MPEIKIKLYGNLKLKAGKEFIPIKATTVSKAIEKLCAHLGGDFKSAVYEGEKIKSHYIVLLNGEILDMGKINSVKVKKFDTVHIIPPVGGG